MQHRFLLVTVWISGVQGSVLFGSVGWCAGRYVQVVRELVVVRRSKDGWRVCVLARTFLAC